jgi:hypothetical protein
MKNQNKACAESILRMWKELIDNSKGDPWFRQGERQAYHDALKCMLYYQLISDYDVMSCEASIVNCKDKSKINSISKGNKQNV